jgi:Na+/melibiose symporter-like transporter
MQSVFQNDRWIKLTAADFKLIVIIIMMKSVFMYYVKVIPM